MLDYYEKLAKQVVFKADGKPYWLVPVARRIRPGDIAGTLNSSGHRQIRCTIDGVSKGVLAHLVLWFQHHKTLPVLELDHRDRNPDFNTINNLREATHAQNMQNKTTYRNSKTGVIGVSPHSVSGYNATIQIANKQKAKWFKTLEAAVQWRKEQAELLHPFRPEEKGSVEDMVRDALTDERFYE